MAKRVNAEEFEAEVLKASLPVIVEFYSDSCIPCKQLSPVLGGIEDDYEDRYAGNTHTCHESLRRHACDHYAVA